MTQPRDNPFIIPALIAVLGLISVVPVSGQTFTTLHSFSAHSGPPYHTNSDGAIAEAGLVLSGEELFGTTVSGGSSGYGTIFRIKTDGTGFTNLHDFTDNIFGTNAGGTTHASELVMSGGKLYGVASIGNFSYSGILYSIKTDGTGFTNLHTFGFGPGNGAYPLAGLLLSGNALFGTTHYSDDGGRGTVFRINVDGTGFTILHSFPETFGLEDTNNQGAFLSAGLVQSGNTLFGTAESGGNFGNGTLFAVNTDGSGFTNLHHFTATSEPFATGTNFDGARPVGKLALCGDKLFGATSLGGTSGYGIVFSINVDGSGFSTLHNFTAIGGDGERPNGDLVLSNDKLYGTTYWGGYGNGMVFAMNTDGTGFTNLHSFNITFEGERPTSGLALADNKLFGTTFFGGSAGYGTIFRLTLPPATPLLTIYHSAQDVVITWPAEATGFKLQSTTNLIGPATWSDVLSAPVIVGGKQIVTNSVVTGPIFFRLSRAVGP